LLAVYSCQAVSRKAYKDPFQPELDRRGKWLM